MPNNTENPQIVPTVANSKQRTNPVGADSQLENVNDHNKQTRGLQRGKYSDLLMPRTLGRKWDVLPEQEGHGVMRSRAAVRLSRAASRPAAGPTPAGPRRRGRWRRGSGGCAPGRPATRGGGTSRCTCSPPAPPRPARAAAAFKCGMGVGCGGRSSRMYRERGWQKSQ